RTEPISVSGFMPSPLIATDLNGKPSSMRRGPYRPGGPIATTSCPAAWIAAIKFRRKLYRLQSVFETTAIFMWPCPALGLSEKGRSALEPSATWPSPSTQRACEQGSGMLQDAAENYDAVRHCPAL